MTPVARGGPATATEVLGLVAEALPTPLGRLLLVTDGDGRLRAAEWTDHRDRLLRLLARHYGPAGYALAEGAAAPAVVAAVAAYFAGELAAIDAVPVATAGTAFQRMVWAALRQIPAGLPVSYAALAVRLGRPAAARAVGHANGANPVSVVVPCHRLVGTDGALTGYAGGLARKRWLIAHEGAPGPFGGDPAA